jgi:hypothetical protein
MLRPPKGNIVMMPPTILPGGHFAVMSVARQIRISELAGIQPEDGRTLDNSAVRRELVMVRRTTEVNRNLYGCYLGRIDDGSSCPI